MKITVIQIGKTKNNQLQQLEQEFLKRISPYAQIDIQTIKDQGEATNEATQTILKLKESKAINEKIPKSCQIIALDETGKQFTSTNFANYLRTNKDSSQNLCFIIGGVYGLDPSIKEKAALILSFSKFTFTHEMIRTLLLEQIYRSFTIIQGKKYHY